MQPLSPEESVRYHRQIIIPGIGPEGQSRIKNASVFLSGLGGLGSISAYYLVAAGIGHLRIVFGQRILPRQEKSMENLARYIIRASFSQERMTYHREAGQMAYQPKDGKGTRVFDALEWLAAMCSHVPNKGEQMVRYYGQYSNVARGKRKKADADDHIPCVLEPEGSSKAFRKN